MDPGGETADWKGAIGYVPTVLSQLHLSRVNAFAFICGPPIMIKLAANILLEWGFNKGDIITTLENKMKCGVGKCGRCNVGPFYVCKHGPVFSYEDLEKMPISDY